MTFIASATIEPTSVRLAGRIMVFPAFASSPKRCTYCSATRSCTASIPPGVWMAAATVRMPLFRNSRNRRNTGERPIKGALGYYNLREPPNSPFVAPTCLHD